MTEDFEIRKSNDGRVFGIKNIRQEFVGNDVIYKADISGDLEAGNEYLLEVAEGISKSFDTQHQEHNQNNPLKDGTKCMYCKKIIQPNEDWIKSFLEEEEEYHIKCMEDGFKNFTDEDRQKVVEYLDKKWNDSV